LADISALSSPQIGEENLGGDLPLRLGTLPAFLHPAQHSHILTAQTVSTAHWPE